VDDVVFAVAAGEHHDGDPHDSNSTR
jgi:hypothetical protein